MKVIAGKYKGRRLKTLDSDLTRPTLAQVKESFFTRLGPYFENGKLLDVFGGSAAITIEFISRGISSAVIIENNKEAQQIIKENLKFVSEPVKLFPMSYQRALNQLTETFDYIYCDPPYFFSESQSLLQQLKKVSHQNTIIFYELDKKEDIELPSEVQCLRVDIYRRTKIMWLQFEQSH